ncbi:MAG: DUF4293 family protein [Saprospirales bacterium]|nr:MAG: DUF4293 family protein [Saprospirales bacterium]
MIQRIQSVFLLLAFLAFAGMVFLPVAQSDQAFGTIMEDQKFYTTEHLWMTIFAMLGGIISLFNIFLFKTRKSQMRFCMIANLFALIWAASAFYQVIQLEAIAGAGASVNHSKAFLMALLAILFLSLAFYFIRKDERLVRSMNSLR